MGMAGNKSDNKNNGSSEINTWEFAGVDSYDNKNTFLTNIDLEKNAILSFRLSIKYGKDKQGLQHVPISANSYVIGFVSGTNWKPSGIIINKTNDHIGFSYVVAGVVEWNLFGITIYSQSKEYKGTVALK